MLTHLEPYLLAPSALPPTALLERLAALTADPALEAALAGGATAVALRSNPLYDAWLVRWSGWETSELHAHAGAYGAYAVLAGSFRETIAGADGVREQRRTTGERVAYRPAYVHRLAPLAVGAVTLHVSSPPRRAPSCFTGVPTTGVPVVVPAAGVPVAAVAAAAVSG